MNSDYDSRWRRAAAMVTAALGIGTMCWTGVAADELRWFAVSGLLLSAVSCLVFLFATRTKPEVRRRHTFSMVVNVGSASLLVMFILAAFGLHRESHAVRTLLSWGFAASGVVWGVFAAAAFMPWRSASNSGRA